MPGGLGAQHPANKTTSNRGLSGLSPATITGRPRMRVGLRQECHRGGTEQDGQGFRRDLGGGVGGRASDQPGCDATSNRLRSLLYPRGPAPARSTTWPRCHDGASGRPRRWRGHPGASRKRSRLFRAPPRTSQRPRCRPQDDPVSQCLRAIGQRSPSKVFGDRRPSPRDWRNCAVSTA